MRKYVVVFFCIVVLLGSATLIGVTTSARDYDLRGYADATLDANLPYRIPRFGVNADLRQYLPQDLPIQLNMMKTAGVYWVRQFIYWDEIETSAGEYNWQQIDPIIDAFRNRLDMELVVVLFRSPDWARTLDNATAPPDDPAETDASPCAGRR